MFHSKYLSWYRHVHGFLEEIGQGVQHIASRVDDIIAFVQEANDRRKVFGEVSAHCDVLLFITSLTHICSITHITCIIS